MGLLKTLESIGQKAGENYIQSSYQSAEVIFGLPIEVVKVIKHPPVQPVFSKISRELATALTKGYQNIQSDIIKNEGNIDINEKYFVKEGDIELIMNKGMEVLEIGTPVEHENPEEVQSFFRDVVVAANAGYLKAQMKATELVKEMGEM